MWDIQRLNVGVISCPCLCLLAFSHLDNKLIQSCTQSLSFGSSHSGEDKNKKEQGKKVKDVRQKCPCSVQIPQWTRDNSFITPFPAKHSLFEWTNSTHRGNLDDQWTCLTPDKCSLESFLARLFGVFLHLLQIKKKRHTRGKFCEECITHKRSLKELLLPDCKFLHSARGQCAKTSTVRD